MIHATAIVDESAIIGQNVKIGPFAIIGPNVVIGDDCDIQAHAIVQGPTVLGKNNKVYSFASIGCDPQDKKYAGEDTRLVIGDNNVFRESCTISRGTAQDSSETRIGNDNLFMAYTHVAHDCIVGNHVILANTATLAGHVEVGDYAILGGFTGIHQFCKVGQHSFCAVGSVVVQDVPPCVTVAGQNAVPKGINSEGLKRRGYSKEQISAVKKAYKVIYRQGLRINEALDALQSMAVEQEHINMFVDFIQASNRGLVR